MTALPLREVFLKKSYKPKRAAERKARDNHMMIEGLRG
jgi:hypothetical protein